jgi:hypothetical protein
MKWVTRARPKIDRLACPWLIRRFIDPEGEILFVPSADVERIAAARGAVPFDIPGVELTHDGGACSFDAFLKKYQLADPALGKLADIVRAADTDTLEASSQAPGLLAISLGLAMNIPDDGKLLDAAMVIYDALYAWCRSSGTERHGWNPEFLNKEMHS